MKIGQFISHFPYPGQYSDPRLIRGYVCSGGEIAAQKVAVNLARMGHEVHVFTASIDRRSSVEAQDGLTVHRFGSWFEVGSTRIAPGLLWGPLREQGLEIVHVQHTTPPGGAAGFLYAAVRRRPLVVTHHGFERYENYGSPARRMFVFLAANFFVDRLFARADAIVAVSPFFVNRSRFLGKYVQKTVSIPNGVDLDEYGTSIPKDEARRLLGLPADRPVILFIGSLIPRKGADMLIAAMRKVADAFPAAELILVGQGPSRSALEAQAAALGLRRQVRFQGFIGEAERKNLYYRAADVLAVPSLGDLEMFPLVLLEGSAAGCAMAVSDLETFRCIIEPGVNAVSAKPGDPDGLAEGIRSILADPELGLRLSRNARERVEKFSWKKVARETENLYRRLISDGGTNRR